MKHQIRLKVLQKLYIINNVIFRPHWLKLKLKMASTSVAEIARC